MVVVGFFWVHGGIYGNEAMLMAGPPLYVFILLGIVPFVYSLPIALIVAELSSAFPEDGGYVVWVQEACGKRIGSHHAYWVWVIYVVDAAIYPVLVANYGKCCSLLCAIGAAICRSSPAPSLCRSQWTRWCQWERRHAGSSPSPLSSVSPPSISRAPT